MQISRNKTLISLLFICTASLYVLNKLLPIVGYYLPGIVYLGLFGLVILLAFGMGISRAQFSRWLRLLPVFAVSFLYLVLYLFTGNFSGAAFYLYGEMQVYLYALIIAVILSKTSEKQNKKLFFVLLFIYAFTAITTYLGCEKYEGAARELATLGTSDYRYGLLVRENIGSFTFIYELIMITPLVIYLIRTQKMNRILGAGVLVIFGATIIQSEYATAVLLFACCMSLLIMPRLTPRMIVLLVILMLVVLILGGTILGQFFEFLSDTFESQTLKNRFQNLADMFLLDDTESGNLGNRIDRYRISINAFFESAMLGNWGQRISGGHSFVLDTMAIFGLLGVGAIILMYRTIYRVCIRPWRGYDFYPYLQFIYLMAICLAVINPKTFLFVFIFVFTLFVKAATINTSKEMVL